MIGSTGRRRCCGAPASRAARGSPPATGSRSTRARGGGRSGLGGAVAVRGAVGEPGERDHERWPWPVAIETLLVVPLLDAAPPVEAIGVAARSMSQQSHIRIERGHYERAVEAIASIAL